MGRHMGAQAVDLFRHVGLDGQQRHLLHQPGLVYLGGLQHRLDGGPQARRLRVRTRRRRVFRIRDQRLDPRDLRGKQPVQRVALGTAHLEEGGDQRLGIGQQVARCRQGRGIARLRHPAQREDVGGADRRDLEALCLGRRADLRHLPHRGGKPIGIEARHRPCLARDPERERDRPAGQNLGQALAQGCLEGAQTIGQTQPRLEAPSVDAAHLPTPGEARAIPALARGITGHRGDPAPVRSVNHRKILPLPRQF